MKKNAKNPLMFKGLKIKEIQGTSFWKIKVLQGVNMSNFAQKHPNNRKQANKQNITKMLSIFDV